MYLFNYASSILMGERVYIFLFNLIPVALLKSCRIPESLYTSLIDPLQKIRILSMKRRCVIFKLLVILILENSPLLFASIGALLRPLANRRKSIGERGNPCWSPLFEVKKGEVEPLMRTTKEVVVMQQKIHFIKL